VVLENQVRAVNRQRGVERPGAPLRRIGWSEGWAPAWRPSLPRVAT